MLEHAQRAGLEAYGVSFHVGSQQPNPEAWDAALGGRRRSSAPAPSAASSSPWSISAAASRRVSQATCRRSKTYGRAIFRALRKHFGNRIPETIIEPGRGMVGDAGVIKAEVVLISKKARRTSERWVYLDIGKFGGLAETMDEAIRYPIRTAHDGERTAPCVIAGPTCDWPTCCTRRRRTNCRSARDRRQGADRGDRGLYQTYSAVAFNGFAPLRSYRI